MAVSWGVSKNNLINKPKTLTMTELNKQTPDPNCAKPQLSSRLFFRTWIEEQKYMAIQGTPDLETLSSFMHHYSDSKNLMQFVMIIDKNNKRIFEGDIVIGKVWGQTQKCLVKRFINGFFPFVAVNSKISYDFDNLKELEVIGNIFENPELL